MSNKVQPIPEDYHSITPYLFQHVIENVSPEEIDRRMAEMNRKLGY